MTDTISNLAQVFPGNTNKTSGYIASFPSVISNLSICNQTASSSTFRIQHCVANAADNGMQYLYYDTPLVANDTLIVTAGITVASGDVIYVYAGVASGISFNFSGNKITS